MRKRQRISKAEASPAPAAASDDETGVTRLVGMLVKEVSVVDRGANRRKFLLVKAADAETAPVEKKIRLTAEGKAKVVAAIETVKTRIDALGAMVAAAVEEDGDDSAEVEKAALEVAERLADPFEKAQWTTAYVNELPDSAFLFVESGDKDGAGKTVPRSKRHFPVKDANGAIDRPHLVNAIARIPQSNASGLSAEDKTKLQDKARKMLAQLAKADADEEVAKAGKKISAARIARLEQARSIIDEILADATLAPEPAAEPEPATSSGDDVAKNASGESCDPGITTPDPNAAIIAMIAKLDAKIGGAVTELTDKISSRIDTVEKRTAAQIDVLAESIDESDARVAEIGKARTGSRQVDADDAARPVSVKKKVAIWPMLDMNEGRAGA